MMPVLDLEPLLKHLRHIDGRDKSLKLIQYALRIVLWRWEPHVISARARLADDPTHPRLITRVVLFARLQNFVGGVSRARKCMRLGNWLDGIARMQRLHSESLRFSSPRELFWKILDVVATCNKVATNTCDDIATLSLLAHENAAFARWVHRANQCWLAGILLALVPILRNIRNLWIQDVEAQRELVRAKEKLVHIQQQQQRARVRRASTGSSSTEEKYEVVARLTRPVSPVDQVRDWWTGRIVEAKTSVKLGQYARTHVDADAFDPARSIRNLARERALSAATLAHADSDTLEAECRARVIALRDGLQLLHRRRGLIHVTLMKQIADFCDCYYKVHFWTFSKGWGSCWGFLSAVMGSILRWEAVNHPLAG